MKVTLERDLEGQTAKIGSLTNLIGVFCSVDGIGGWRLCQDDNVRKWVTAVKEYGILSQKNKANPELAALDVTAIPDSQESRQFSRCGDDNTGRHGLVVKGDPIIRRVIE